MCTTLHRLQQTHAPGLRSVRGFLEAEAEGSGEVAEGHGGVRVVDRVVVVAVGGGEAHGIHVAFETQPVERNAVLVDIAGPIEHRVNG